MPSELQYKVYSDLRWPLQTGIGCVMTAMIERKPPDIDLVDLRVRGRVGSPLSPLAISRALLKVEAGGIFWSPGFIPPVSARVPIVVTVHDLTHLRFYGRLRKQYYDLILRPIYRSCAAVVCVSEYTRREFLAWSGMPSEKVHVVMNGVSRTYTENRDKLVLPYQYVLYAGNHRRYKNLERLITAYSMSSLPRQNIHLVMTGMADPHLTRHARQLEVDEYLHFFGHVSDENLPRLYKGALLLAFVSLYEGFGLPILEAMGSCVPVLTSNVSSMPEIAGDAAMLVNPYSVPEIAHGLDLLAADEQRRDDLVLRGKDRVRKFDWNRSAQNLWSIVASVAAAR